ncbi:hypothetical protein JCGZ_17213 [Jatropha curcas]|uniref:Uncharacterized protein n=1 Tax=Jatropha curcas TaxID=180498 RepID=A0A067LAV5_JATCU|nr:hypothetical protein JCGZ_17213 [Jatropha curcas]
MPLNPNPYTLLFFSQSSNSTNNPILPQPGLVQLDSTRLDSMQRLDSKHFVWEETITVMLKVAWDKLCALRYANFTYKMRKNGRSRHIARSIFVMETSQLLAEKYGREPTPMEVFTYIHTKDHDGHTFVDRCVISISENYSTAHKRIVSSQAGSEAEPRIDELALYLEAAGGKKKGKVYGIGDRELAEFRAHVMRISDLHSSGTSSSDSPPAIDPHVSTLHQPPSSPLHPDTVDNTLVTPANTTADTTLDCPENHYRGFDFRPF